MGILHKGYDSILSECTICMSKRETYIGIQLTLTQFAMGYTSVRLLTRNHQEKSTSGLKQIGN